MTQVKVSTLERPSAEQPTEVVPVQPVEASHPRRNLLLSLVMALALFLGSLFLNSFRTMQAVDLTADESTYAIESAAVHRVGMTKWNGTPFFVHPPLFFATEAILYKSLGVGEGPLFTRLVGPGYNTGEALLAPETAVGEDTMQRAIEVGRYLNAFYGALLTVLIFFFGRALLGWQLGLLASVLFALDPYVVWRHHFNYLEPLATIFGVLCIFAYYRAQGAPDGRSRWGPVLLSGLFLGLALLSKELSLLYFAAIALHWLLFRRTRLHEVLATFGVGMAVYSLFPIWTALSGEFDIWWDAKSWLLNRGTGRIQDSGIGKPGTSFVDTLLVNLPDYWPWFVLLGLAGMLAVGYLYLYYRHRLRDPGAELLAASVLGTYGFFLVVRLVGGVINEQYFYFLMPLVVLTVGYAAVQAPRFLRRARVDEESEGASASRRTSVVRVGLLALLGLLVGYNAVSWVARYALGTDDSYIRVEGALAQEMPPGTEVVGRDLLDVYIMPKQRLYTFSYLNLIGKYAEPANILERRIPYAILNDQSVQQRYGGANPRYYEWVRENGEELRRFAGRRYNTYVYQMDYTGAAQTFGANSLGVGRPASTSSSENGEIYGPEKAFDAGITTRWSSRPGSDSEWLYVDLGESKAFSTIELYWEEAFARQYELQVSEDAQQWSTFYETGSGVGSLETIQAAARGRYVRLLMTARGSPFGYSLWEFSIYP